MDNKAIKLMYLLGAVFAAGFAVAAIVMILILPQSGKKTREQIAQRAKELMHRQQSMLKRLTGQNGRKQAQKDQEKSWLQKLIA